MTLLPVAASRRRFIRSLGTAAAGVGLPAVWTSAMADETRRDRNATIQLGVIGAGPRCQYDLQAMLGFDDVRCIAVADVQATRRQAAKRLVDERYGNQDCQTYRDFRELLERSDIDAVLIATGDRWHADASILAAAAGKDIYCEKPCGITIERCQRLAETIQRTERVFQAGTQRRSVPNFRRAVELVHAGKIGRLHTMHASVYQPLLSNTWLPAEPAPPRDEVDWNLWLGPAPWRPYNHNYVEGAWRGQWDFDSGARLLDWGAHTVDLCQWANQADQTMPVEYEPEADKIICHYANGVKLVIDFLPQPFGDRAPHYTTRLGTCPVRFVGDEGSIETGDSGQVLAQPDALQRLFSAEVQRVRGLDVSAHARDFFDCIRTRATPRTGAAVMRRSHLACHAAATAWILGRPLKFDPHSESFVDDPAANQFLSRPARQWAG